MRGNTGKTAGKTWILQNIMHWRQQLRYGGFEYLKYTLGMKKNLVDNCQEDLYSVASLI